MPLFAPLGMSECQSVPGSAWSLSFPFASELAEGVGRNQTAEEPSGHVLSLHLPLQPDVCLLGGLHLVLT